MSASEEVLIAKKDLEEFAEKCLVISGSAPENAKQVAEVCVSADVRGVSSHGVNRLEMYCEQLQNGRCVGSGEPQEVNGSKMAIGLVDGCNLQVTCWQGVISLRWR
jgi:(2R)-3-sulfolactate dehydrogenase (NADP+)